MVEKNSQNAPEDRPSIETLLGTLGRSLPQLRCFKHGTIVFRMTDGAGHFKLDASAEGVKVLRDAATQSAPLVEVIGKSRDLQGVLSGKTDARKRFFAGAFRVRGDLRYFSDLAIELGILKEPL